MHNAHITRCVIYTTSKSIFGLYHSPWHHIEHLVDSYWNLSVWTESQFKKHNEEKEGMTYYSGPSMCKFAICGHGDSQFFFFQKHCNRLHELFFYRCVGRCAKTNPLSKAHIFALRFFDKSRVLQQWKRKLRMQYKNKAMN